MEKKGYGSGRVLYWAHVAGVTEKRGSVRSGETAFDLIPLTTPSTPYENVLLVDLATHPRLIHTHNLQAMLPPGVHLTQIALGSMPAIARDCIEKTVLETGETVWTVNDTTRAFQAYWMDGEALDLSQQALEAQHARIRAIAGPHCHIPLRMFPIPYQSVIALTAGNMCTVSDLTGVEFHDMRSLCGLSTLQTAQAFRVLEATLRARRVEPDLVHPAADDMPHAIAAE